MRIVINGQQAFGKAVLESLIERGDNVVAVYCAPDKPGRPADPLKQAAVERGLPVHQPASFKDPAVLDTLRALEPDLCVMAYVVLLVPESVLYAPTHGTIQYHPSLLPRHRGPSSINWPIIQGETGTGLSIFWPDKGLDTGPVLLQKEIAIGPDDTLGSIYFEHLFPMGVAAMIEAVDLVKSGAAPKIAQDETQATYEGWCRKEDVAIDWSRPAAEVHNLIRGANPQPGAWTTCNGKMLQIYDCVRLAAVDGAPGEVTEATTGGLIVAAGGGAIQVKRVRPEGDQKMPAGDFVAAGGVKPGGVLGER
ncbi:MAG: methionyl-tRNA formyltransferase [Proteobacteria bacterium]|nr:methionyl-tRNA formyltransferase [Pseudomonadota bacterium]